MEGVSPPADTPGLLSYDFRAAYTSHDNEMWKDALQSWVDVAPRFGYPPLGAGARTYEQQLALYRKYMPDMVEDLPTRPPPRNWKPLLLTIGFITLFILLTLMWVDIAKGQPGAG